jgi:hypothetical protein
VHDVLEFGMACHGACRQLGMEMRRP